MARMRFAMRAVYGSERARLRGRARARAVKKEAGSLLRKSPPRQVAIDVTASERDKLSQHYQVAPPLSMYGLRLLSSLRRRVLCCQSAMQRERSSGMSRARGQEEANGVDTVSTLPIGNSGIDCSLMSMSHRRVC